MQPRVGGEEMEMEGQQVQNLNFRNNNQSYNFGGDHIFNKYLKIQSINQSM